MKPLLLMLLLAAMPAIAQDKYTPTSVGNWQSQSDNSQVKYILTFVDRVAAGEAATYKVTPDRIRQFFTQATPPRKVADGITMVMVATELLDRQAKAGHIDLRRVYIEDVIQWAIDMKFNANFP